MGPFNRVSHTLFVGPIGALERVGPHTVGVTMNHGAEIDEEGMKAIQTCMQALIDEPPVMHLVDRRTPYCLTHEAQQCLAGDEHLLAVAYLVDRMVSHGVSDFARSTYLSGVAVEAFAQRDDAMAWLDRRLAEWKAHSTGV